MKNFIKYKLEMFTIIALVIEAYIMLLYIMWR